MDLRFGERFANSHSSLPRLERTDVARLNDRTDRAAATRLTYNPSTRPSNHQSK